MSKHSHILIPKYRELELPSFGPDMKTQGFLRLVKRSKYTDIVIHDSGWFPNIITDAGLNRRGTGSAISRCCIGTGTAAAVAGDVALGTFVASTQVVAVGAAGITNEGSPNYVSGYEFGFRFNAGVLNGNYSELGMGWADANLWSRALIVDGGGSPTTISVGVTEYLDVFYKVRQVPDLADYTSTVTISGSSYDVTRRPANVSATGAQGWYFYNNAMFWAGADKSYGFSGALAAVTAQPSGDASIFSSYSTDAYVNNSLESTGSTIAGLDSGNVPGGIKSITVYGGGIAYQYGFVPNLPKDNTKELVLQGKTSWARV